MYSCCDNVLQGTTDLRYLSECVLKGVKLRLIFNEAFRQCIADAFQFGVAPPCSVGVQFGPCPPLPKAVKVGVCLLQGDLKLG